MNDIEFNLLDEPWIRVMRPDCSLSEVSLTDVILHAHEYEDLAGELPTQDIAVMRVILAVLHTVFDRVDAEGVPEPLDEENALDRWEELWDLKAFPEKPIRDYLTKWHDRFWLFHPERPFFQVPEAVIGTEYAAPKLNGEVSESSNKIRLFSTRFGEPKENLSFSEAARWLINTNAFDDTSAKPKGKNLPSVGAGWLGKLGLIVSQGRNLFETLMLNLVFLKNDSSVWGKSKPVWELSIPRTTERSEITVPDNPAELYTLQSRRLILKRNDNGVSGFNLLGGDFFPKENAYPNEPMTIWRPVFDGKKSIIGFQPGRHDESKQIWRNFPSIVSETESAKRSGVVSWKKILTDNEVIRKNDFLRFKIASVQYGDKDFFVTNVFSDFLTFHAGLLTEAGQLWMERIKSELASIDEIAKLVWGLSMNLLTAEGNENTEQANRSKEQFYFRTNEPFRLWLAKLSSDQDPEMMAGLSAEWHEQAKRIARDLGKDMVEDSGPKAFAGRRMTDKNNNTRSYSAPGAYNIFIGRLNHIYDAKGV